MKNTPISYSTRLTVVVLVLSVMVLVACSPFRPSLRHSPEGDMPRAYSVTPDGATRSWQWWKDFDDPELDVLINEALSGNFTLGEAWARLTQVRATAVQAGAELYPQLSLSADGSVSSERSDSGAGGDTHTVKSYSLGLASSYEVDLWGKIRAGQEAALLEASAAREDVNAAAMSVAAEVAERWINIIALRMQKALLETQLETSLTYLELTELRYRKSLVSALDVYQQRQVVEKVKAEIPLVEAEEQVLMHELAVLLGKQPRACMNITRKTLPLVGKPPALGVPADLLSARPDVRAAFLLLQSADWQVSAARADRLPNISVSASALYGAGELELIFDNWILNLAAHLTAPLWDGKRRAAEVDRTRAVADEKLIAYRETVYTAVKEVENALVNEDRQRRHIGFVEEQIGAARRALEEARLQYVKGVNDYLPVLTQLNAAQDLEIGLIDKRSALLIDRITLYRALGGTWVDALEPGADAHSVDMPHDTKEGSQNDGRGHNKYNSSER